jgi:hypothetical protein
VNHRTTVLERVAIGVASLVLSIGLIALLSGFFQNRDQAGVASGSTPPPGVRYRDQGDRHLAIGELQPEYDSDPPTSGPHVPLPVERNATRLSDDQLLEALELGDVVIAYGTAQPPPGLAQLAQQVAGRFTPQLAAAGQAVVLDARPATRGLIALAWTRMLQVSTAGDPQLRAFAEGWLGRGAPGS